MCLMTKAVVYLTYLRLIETSVKAVLHFFKSQCNEDV